MPVISFSEAQQKSNNLAAPRRVLYMERIERESWCTASFSVSGDMTFHYSLTMNDFLNPFSLEVGPIFTFSSFVSEAGPSKDQVRAQ